MILWPRPWDSLRRRRPAKDARTTARLFAPGGAARLDAGRWPWVWPAVVGACIAGLHLALFPPLPRVGSDGFPSAGEIAPEDIRSPIVFMAPLLPRDIEILQIEKVLVEPPVLRWLTTAGRSGSLARVTAFAEELTAAAAAEQPNAEVRARRIADEFGNLDARDVERVLASPDLARLATALPEVARDVIAAGIADMLPPGQYSRVIVADRAGGVARDLSTITPQSRLVEVLTARLRESGLAPADAIWAAGLLRPFLTPNLIYDAEATRLNQEAARQSVPATREFIPGERIVEKGDRVTEQEELYLETLHETLIAEGGTVSLGERLARLVIRLLLLVVVLGLYGWLAWSHFRPVLTNLRFLFTQAIILAVFLAAAAFAGSSAALGAFAVPIAFLALLATVLFKEQAGYAATICGLSLIGVLPDAVVKEMLALMCLGLITVVTVRRIQKRSQFYQILGRLTLVSVALVTLVRASQGLTIPEIGAEYLPAVFTPIIAVAFALFLLPLIEPLVGVSSDLTLLELSDLNHPLLQRMALEAPGTYHHSQVVSQLAEQAARAINANALQVRVGALFHDIGKMQKAEYYVENQQPGRRSNKHDELSPSMSALIIASHVKDGIDLARRWRLPQVVIDFIPQHHGTQVMEYFYHKALEGEGNETVKVDDFRYPGPKPQRRETAILMLADAVEAATRSLAKPTPSRIKEVTKQICDKRLLSGELDESNLTLADVARVREAFIPLLTGIHHARVVYPGQKEERPERRVERTHET